jgi:stress response protein SCP2
LQSLSFLDERLKDYLVPFSQRSASKALKTIVRGSRIPLSAENTVRFFIWWKNGKERTDIDLSAVFFDADYKYIDLVSYYNLENFGGHHSGDIVDAPEGAAEFIDVGIKRLIEHKVRFIVMSINSFTSQPFCDLPECFAGWMARTHADSGEIFEPKTVRNKIDISSDTKICLPLIIDLQEQQVIWTDIALKKYPMWNNVANNLSSVTTMLKAMTNLRKTTLYDLFSLHIKSRGEFVSDKNQGENIFSVEEGITPFNLETIASEFMQ